MAQNPLLGAEVLVTTGGTSEPIDDVRSVTNFSTGRFGLALADALTDLGADVTVAGSSLALAHAPDKPLWDAVEFRSTDDLQGILSRPGTPGGHMPVVVHAAAVSDYRPVPFAGKMPSDQDEITVRMERTPKLIDGLRATHGTEAFLVGFKLLSGSTDAELFNAAHTLCRRAKLNLVVANDLTELRDGQHPCWLVTAEGGMLRVEGTRSEAAETVARFVAHRRDVTWAATRLLGDVLPPVDSGDRDRFAGTLRFAQQTGLLIDTNGNAAVTTRPDAGGVRLLVTPRQLDKSRLRASDMCVADIDLDAGTVSCWGRAKSSIDTSVQARVVAGLPSGRRLVHSHSWWGRAQAATTFPYPCGAAEEAGEVTEALSAAGVDISGPAWHAELVCHGSLFVCDDTGFARLRSDWADVMRSWNEHLADVGASADEPGVPMPIFDGTRVVGTVVRYADKGGVAVYVTPEGRGSGVGRDVTAQLVARRQPVVTVDECGVVDYWESRGFSGVRLDDGTWRFSPPRNLGTHPVLTG